MSKTDTDLDDFSDLDFDEEDEFADLDEFAEPEVEVSPNHIDLGKPLCATCGDGDVIPGPSSRSKCQRCGLSWKWDHVEEPVTKAKKKDETPRVIMSGHCNTPQTSAPHKSHERCTLHGAGSTANPEKRFHPCPCTCHLGHNEEGEVEVYDCGGCTGLLAEWPVGGVDTDGDPIYVHVNRRTHQMIYTGPCR